MQIIATPVLQNERADILDVLRGFALLGVMLDNLFGFTGWGYTTQQQHEALATWPADGIVALAEQVFIHGKFYSLFSLLFGIGFAIIMLRNEAKGINPLKVFYRRLFVLLLIGAVHLFFIWEGDILFLYALVGMLLPLFRKMSDKKLLLTAGALILSPLIFDCVYVLLQVKPGKFFEAIAFASDKATGIPTDNTYGSYLFKEGSGWQQWRNWQASGWAYRWSYLLDTNRIPKVLGMFLFGLYAGRKLMHLHLENYIVLFKKLRFWGFVIGVPAAAACTYFEIFQKHIPSPVGLANTFFYAISVVPLSFAYTSALCLHWMNAKGNSRLKILAPMGRMALTNYLMQTVIGIVLYYGVGLGFGGNIGPALFIPIGIAVYTLQVLYSFWWFKYFQYGPLEWIWRQLTYGKGLPIKK